jgi:mono/diheme cytochrome c family protein
MNVNKPKEDLTRYLVIGIVLTVIILVAVGIYMVLESPRLVEAAEETSNEAVSEGRKIYQEQCANCHGAQGEGGVGPALNNKELLTKASDHVLFSLIRSGVPLTQMPAWSIDYGGPLTDQEVRNVVSFIRSWEPNAPVIQAPTFEPSAERGALTFANTCSTCHGKDGEGTDSIPALNDPQKLAGLDDKTFQAAVMNGLVAQGMPGYSGLFTSEQLADLTALIGAWRQGEDVATPYQVTDEVAAAIFALQRGDADSANLRLDNAISVATGMATSMLMDAKDQLDAGNASGALASLISFNKQWPIGDPAVGQPLYAEKCAPCHGQKGEGGVGKALNPSEFVEGQTNADLVKFILTGRPGTAMAGFKGRLTEAEIADIVAFLREWSPMP